MVVVVSELWCCHNNLTCTQHLATKTSNCAPLATTLLATAPRLSYNARTALSEPFCTCQHASGRLEAKGPSNLDRFGAELGDGAVPKQAAAALSGGARIMPLLPIGTL